MSSSEKKKADAALCAEVGAALDVRPGRRFRVVLEGIRAEYETSGSFAIKFGLAISEPVTKIKHMLRSLPAKVWEGENASTAAGLLAIIEEAGGRARIEELTAQQRNPAGAVQDETEAAPGGATGEDVGCAGSCCPKCGFPVRAGERHCQFCLSALTARPGRKVDRSAGAVARAPAASIPAKRLLIYALIALSAVVFRLLTG